MKKALPEIPGGGRFNEKGTIMKQNAILLTAVMLAAAGCTHQGGYGRAGMDTGMGSSDLDGGLHGTTEHIDRNPDGAIRTGGTLRARGIEPYQSSYNDATTDIDMDSEMVLDDEPMMDRDDFGQRSSTAREPGQASDSVRGSANWNPSDDLLRDGLSDDSSFNNDASIGGAATHESGSAQSQQESVPELNSSENLEKNISGEFDLETGQFELENDQFETRDLPPPQVGVTGTEPEWLFENNRAQGVGSGATGDFGVATSRDPLGLPEPKNDEPNVLPETERKDHDSVLGHDLEDRTNELQR
jgi:hypothetical protein